MNRKKVPKEGNLLLRFHKTIYLGNPVNLKRTDPSKEALPSLIAVGSTNLSPSALTAVSGITL